jgi:UDP-N-acetylglucosamine diphosphorylase/glucosamine-1-phosphate N-acetyltransferase
MQAVILAAGKGTRMSPITETRPKPLIPVAGKPFLTHLIQRLPKEVSEVVLVVGHKKEMIQKQMGEKIEGRKTIYVEQKQQLGTGHAILQAEKTVSGDFICLAGDHLWGASDLSKLAKSKGIVVMGRKVGDVSSYGYLEVEGTTLKKIIEKPKTKKPGLVNISAYRFEPKIFDALKKVKPSPRGEIEVVDAINDIAKNGDVGLIECEEWVDFSKPWHILEVNQKLMEKIGSKKEGKISIKATIDGQVQIGKGTRVLAGAYITGPVVIGQNCLIGPNCYIRPHTSIGDNCHAGNGVEIKNSVIFSNTNIPHLNYVGDSVIGEGCNLGAGTKVANLMHDGNVKMEINGELVDTGRRKLGAVIGDNVKTGINTSIYPGRKIGSNSTTDVAAVVKKNIPQKCFLMNTGEIRNC